MAGFIQAAASALLGGGSEPPDTLLSGFRDVHAGGIAVGSKVVGSGSAATTIPPLSVSPGATFSGSSDAVSGAPRWLPYAVAALGVVALLSLLAPRSRR